MTVHNFCVDYITLLCDPKSNSFGYGMRQKAATYFNGKNDFSLGKTLQFNGGFKGPVSFMQNNDPFSASSISQRI